VVTNLDADGNNNSSGSDIALSEKWDGNESSPIGDEEYEYQTTLKLYDSLGSTHDITIYYDKADTASTWEFIVTCNPDEDNREIFNADTDAGRGMLGRGTIKFNANSGTIEEITFSRFVGKDGGGNPDDMTDSKNWDDQSTSTDLTNGYFTFAPKFTNGDAMKIKLDFGSRYNSGWVNDSLTTTQYSSASTTTYQAANGYGAGDLQSISVGTDGIITGHYSNGQVLSLYRIALAKFQNPQGLFKVGGNLFRETRNSGDAITNKPGTNGLGSISSNSLEQSNVDIATEFVRMISTQRGFQANSKIITVTDQMLAELINIKR